jgi:nitrite reductase/ring-hydroxylating ferredoxin subunit
MSRHVVAAASEIKPGEKKLVTVKGREIGVFNVDGAFFALANRCPHAGGPMCEGRVVGLVQSRGPGDYSIGRKGEFVRCPWHGWEFDIRTGQSWCDPAGIRARRYAVSVQPGTGLVAGPYVAETVPVTIEADYVVVEA